MIKLYANHYDLRSIMYIPLQEEFTIVHNALLHKNFEIMFYFIEELGFDVDFHKKQTKLTLLHVVAKHHN